MPTRGFFLQAGLCAVPVRRSALAIDTIAPRQKGSAASSVINLMPDFWAAYTHAGVKTDADRIARWLPHFDAMAADVRRVVAVPALYAAHATRFRVALPDFDFARAKATKTGASQPGR